MVEYFHGFLPGQPYELADIVGGLDENRVLLPNGVRGNRLQVQEGDQVPLDLVE